MGELFTHFDTSGNAIMVDVSPKEITARVAVARGVITVNEQTMQAVKNSTAAKGDVLGVARIAGIMAAKKTSELIPMCHPLFIEKCSIDFALDEVNSQIEATCTVKITGKTGVEMEALTGVSASLLTIYDMCKAIDRTMIIGSIRLCEKSGGKSGDYIRDEDEK